MVAALIACFVVNFNLLQANDNIKFIFPVGHEPGLKSLANANGIPLDSKFLAFA